MFWLLQCLSEVKCQTYWNLCFVSWQHGIHSNKTFQSDVTNTTSICTKLFMQRWYSAFKRQLFETHSLHSLSSTLTLKLAGNHSPVSNLQKNHTAENYQEIRLLCLAPLLTSQRHRSVAENKIWLHGRVGIFITKKKIKTSLQKSISSLVWYLNSKLLLEKWPRVFFWILFVKGHILNTRLEEQMGKKLGLCYTSVYSCACF